MLDVQAGQYSGIDQRICVTSRRQVRKMSKLHYMCVKAKAQLIQCTVSCRIEAFDLTVKPLEDWLEEADVDPDMMICTAEFIEG